MVEARRFHSNFMFIIPLTQGVLIVIILDFCKNTAFFAQQVKNLAPSSPATSGDGHIIEKPKEPTYLAAQYIYAIWLIVMMLKALIGIRANLEFHLRWMAKYNLLLAIDTGFEFIHTTLGVIFEDMSQMDEAATIRHYCVGFLILIFQIYGFICCWLHLKWVRLEMPHLTETPQESFWRLVFPCIGSRSGSSSRRDTPMAEVSSSTTNREPSPSAEAGSSSQPQPAAHSSTPSLTADRGSISLPTGSGDQASTEVAHADATSTPDIQVVVQT
ncbi:MAG: hypothetical protein J3Q66DRAFT_342368 [Benniella sp.]|nr:MAG: hypothetical protein J3Q66DRAFT_342368 [Benniella sp.]